MFSFLFAVIFLENVGTLFLTGNRNFYSVDVYTKYIPTLTANSFTNLHSLSPLNTFIDFFNEKLRFRNCTEQEGSKRCLRLVFFLSVKTEKG